MKRFPNQKLTAHSQKLASAIMFLMAILFFTEQGIAQCTPGTLTVSTNNLVVNTFFPGTASVNAGRSAITLGTSVGSATAISKGDFVLIIQMQGSTINSANSNSYGDGVGTGDASGYLTSTAGTYEYAIAANNVAVGGGTLYVTKPLTNSYTNSVANATTGAYRFQVIRVPRYSSLTFTAGNAITATPWNGTAGGVVAYRVTGTMALAGGTFVNVAAQGFRGGGGRQLGGTGLFNNADARTAPTSNGSKGEGIAGTPQYVRTQGYGALVNAGSDTYPNGSNGNGAPGNAGGGATDGNPGGSNEQNAGGAGGGNGGAGGRGGKAWQSNLPTGGYGGVAPAFLSSSRLILGGGGGAGSTNDGTGAGASGLSSSGGAGGGLVMIRVGTVTGTGTINANGENAESVLNDGAGAGGAGGTIYFNATTGIANVSAIATGGNGGNAWPAQADAGGLDDGNPEHGPGGGGGGGAIYSNAALSSAVVTGGTRGTTLVNTQAFGAVSGSIGVYNNAATLQVISFNATCDLDDDNDGILDVNEAAGGTDPYNDADADGVPNVFDNVPGGTVPAWVDVNGDGINDNFDADLDGILNSQDLDSDNDGIPDLVEAGGVDSNGDGFVDVLTDANANGVPDKYDVAGGGVAIANLDSDGDGVPNFRDLDSDNDGIPDVTEVGGVDVNGDGRIDGFTDTDGDGLDDRADSDVGNDGIVEASSRAFILTGGDANNDGVPDSYPAGSANTDGRGNPNPYDLDSDDDGIADIIEAGGVDTNNDGRVDTFADADGDGYATLVDPDTNNDGVMDNVAAPILVTGADANLDGRADSYPVADNADGSGPANPYDADSDNDGIPDLVEAGGIDTNGDGRIDGLTDADNDGWQDAYDLNQAGINIRGLDANGAGTGGGVFDYDGDGVANYLDLDSDNDGVPDILEQGGVDADNDGKVDVATDVDGDGFIDNYDPINNSTGGALGTAIISTGATVNANNIPGTYSAGDNVDGTGLINMLDLDADGDGILDVREAGLTDATNDGLADGTRGADGWSDTVDALVSINIPNSDNRGAANYLDIDSDDDGLTDNVEGQTTAGFAAAANSDLDFDGIDDTYDNDDAVYAGTTSNGITPVNTDGADQADYRDLDADNDGIADLVEAGGVDTDGDGKIDAIADADSDGLQDKYDVSTGGVNIANGDFDGDGVRNFRDLDSDNDGIPDVTEVGGVDVNGDGRIDGFTDTDGDGLDDRADSDVGNDGIIEASTRAFILTGADGNNDGLPDTYPAGASNSDGRGNPNPYDVDSDDDGIADIIEAGGTDANNDGRVDTFADADGDGYATLVDPDINNDGTMDNAAAPILVTGADANLDGRADSYPVADNADGSTLANPYDLDSDNDGIPDLVESGGVDTNGDGRIDNISDADGNGWQNAYDPTQGGINIRTLDGNGAGTGGGVFNYDGDVVANYLDLDSDNDGIPDILEQGGADTDNDGKVDVLTDADNDGFVDIYDPVNNSTGTALGTAIISTGAAVNANNIPVTYSAGDDVDRTGLINMLDLDADGDGILDVREAGLTDATNDGIADGTLGADGWSDSVDGIVGAIPIANTDGRGGANYVDVDSDDDGITDNVEGQTTAGYVLPTGSDSDFDGIDNAYDNNSAAFGGNTNNGIAPNNHDLTDTPDYIDSDSDNDGLNDLREGLGNTSATLTNTADADNDGLVDQFDNFNLNTETSNLQNNVTNANFGAGGSNTGVAIPGSNSVVTKTLAGSPNRDWRNSNSVLPVNFTSITATVADHGVQVSWTVENEDNIQHYIVERSKDGVTFTSIGLVAYRKVNAPSQTYQFLDKDVNGYAGALHYRIREVDNDAKFILSKVVSVRIEAKANSMTVLGNPVQGNKILLNIGAQTAGKAVVRVIDMQGKVLIQQNLSLSAGDNRVSLSIDNRFVASAIYFVSANVNGHSMLERVTVAK